MSKYEDIDRLLEISNEIRELIDEARQLFQGTCAERRFEAYAYPHIRTALSRDHSYLGGSFITFRTVLMDWQQMNDVKLHHLHPLQVLQAYS